MALNCNPVLTPFKRGDTFMFTCRYKVNGVPVDVTNIEIRAQIRDRLGALVATLQPVLADQTDQTGVFYLEPVIPDTSGWSVGRHSGDIQITEGGMIRSTTTFTLPVVEDITR